MARGLNDSPEKSYDQAVDEVVIVMAPTLTLSPSIALGTSSSVQGFRIAVAVPL